VTNLIDLGFTLLIIFMITTPLVEQSIQVDLPYENAKEQKIQDPPKVEVISIDSKGRYFWGATMVTLDELSSRLSEAADRPVQPIISLRADRTLSYQVVVDVLGVIEKSGLTKLNMDTQASVK
jgi:biopolymer transport protein ExbD